MNMMSLVATSPAGRSLQNAKHELKQITRELPKFIHDRHRDPEAARKKLRQAKYWKSVIELLT
jgi:hypothetical protein